MMKNSIFHLLGTIILLLIIDSSQIFATDYYISPSGNDSNDGKARTTAFASIEKLNSMVFKPGDKIFFESDKKYIGNLVFDTSDGGSATNPVIVGSVGNGAATINGGDGNGIQIAGSAGITIQNLKMTGSGRNINHRGTGVLVDAGRDIIIDNVEVEGFQWAGIMIYGGSENVKVIDVYAHDNGYTGIGTGYKKREINKNLYIGYCRSVHNPGISDPSKYININDQSGSGISLSHVEGALVEYCESTDNGGDFYHIGGNGPVGIWLIECKDVTVQYCISHDNKSQRMSDGHYYSDGGGFDFDSATKNCLMQYCYSYNNAGSGFLLCAWDTVEAHMLENNTMRYCISENDGQRGHLGGIYIHNSVAQRNMQVYNNVVYNSAGRNCVRTRPGEGGVKGSFYFRNNIFVIRGTGAFVEGLGPGAVNHTVFQGNCYWNYNNPGNWDGLTNFEEWKKLGQEVLNGKSVGMNVDPLLTFDDNVIKLTDPTKILRLYEYLLQDGSPCIDAGINLTKSFKINTGKFDFFGNKLPKGLKYDIGVHER